jgi:hypothetical protein
MKTATPVFDTLQSIGRYFHERLVTDAFVEDPPMSFEIDNDVSVDMENCLRLALNHGAIVCYERADAVGGYMSLKGKRFRLSHLLAPVFKLPLRKSKAARLSVIMERQQAAAEIGVESDRRRDQARTQTVPPPPKATPSQGVLEW